MGNFSSSACAVLSNYPSPKDVYRLPLSINNLLSLILHLLVLALDFTGQNAEEHVQSAAAAF